MIVKARFDGRVFVPEGPVDLPAGQVVSFSIDLTEATPTPAATTTTTPLLDLIDQLDRLPNDPDWPEDASAQHDHYLYGMPKRP